MECAPREAPTRSNGAGAKRSIENTRREGGIVLSEAAKQLVPSSVISEHFKAWVKFKEKGEKKKPKVHRNLDMFLLSDLPCRMYKRPRIPSHRFVGARDEVQAADIIFHVPHCCVHRVGLSITTHFATEKTNTAINLPYWPIFDGREQHNSSTPSITRALDDLLRWNVPEA